MENVKCENCGKERKTYDYNIQIEIAKNATSSNAELWDCKHGILNYWPKNNGLCTLCISNLHHSLFYHAQQMRNLSELIAIKEHRIEDHKQSLQEIKNAFTRKA